MGYRVCSAVVKNGSILMVHHVHDGEDYWTLPGGGVEPGESPEQAAMREVFEETGLRVTVSKTLYQDEGERCFLAVALDDREAIQGMDPELHPRSQVITGVAWFALKDLATDFQVSRFIHKLEVKSPVEVKRPS